MAHFVAGNERVVVNQAIGAVGGSRCSEPNFTHSACLLPFALCPGPPASIQRTQKVAKNGGTLVPHRRQRTTPNFVVSVAATLGACATHTLARQAGTIEPHTHVNRHTSRGTIRSTFILMGTHVGSWSALSPGGKNNRRIPRLIWTTWKERRDRAHAWATTLMDTVPLHHVNGDREKGFWMEGQ